MCAAVVANCLTGLEDVFDVAHDLLEQLPGATVGHFPVGVSRGRAALAQGRPYRLESFILWFEVKQGFAASHIKRLGAMPMRDEPLTVDLAEASRRAPPHFDSFSTCIRSADPIEAVAEGNVPALGNFRGDASRSQLDLGTTKTTPTVCF